MLNVGYKKRRRANKLGQEKVFACPIGFSPIQRALVTTYDASDAVCN